MAEKTRYRVLLASRSVRPDGKMVSDETLAALARDLLGERVSVKDPTGKPLKAKVLSTTLTSKGVEAEIELVEQPVVPKPKRKR